MILLKAILFFWAMFGAVMAVNALKFGYGPEDAFWRTLMTPFEGTVWAPGFSEAAFSKVKVGMAANEVASLLGEPLRKDCGDKNCFWSYTGQDTGTADFDQRWVIVGNSGRVEEIRKSFFID